MHSLLTIIPFTVVVKFTSAAMERICSVLVKNLRCCLGGATFGYANFKFFVINIWHHVCLYEILNLSIQDFKRLSCSNCVEYSGVEIAKSLFSHVLIICVNRWNVGAT